jgi:hypothetical protein
MTRSPTPSRCRPRLEQLEDRSTPSCMSADCPPVITAPLGGGHAQVLLLLSADSLARQLPNGAIDFWPPSPIRGLLTAAFPAGPAIPGDPVIPTSFQGNLGGSAVALNVNADGVTIALPGGAVRVPPDPCLPGLLTAAGWAG